MYSRENGLKAFLMNLHVNEVIPGNIKLCSSQLIRLASAPIPSGSKARAEN